MHNSGSTLEIEASTITVELPAEIEERFVAQARIRGLSLDAYVRECLTRSAQSPSPAPTLSTDELNRMLDEAATIASPRSMSPEEWGKALDECFDRFPTIAALPDHAFDRENIYGREDKW